jgi:apolipoprotein N-acyltransferase
VGGLSFFGPALQWMRYADNLMVAAWAMLAFYCSLYFPAAIFMIRRLERWRLPLVVTVPLVWAALEYLRCFLMTGFSWYLLAHTQHDVLSMIQITDLGGVFLVSALVALVNAFLFEWVCQYPQVRRCFNLAETESRNLLPQGVVVAAFLIGTCGYGVYRLGQNEFQTGPTVCLLQSNLDVRIRNDAARPQNDGNSAKVVVEHFGALCRGAALHSSTKPDLLIWPETSFPRAWIEVSPQLPIEKVPMEWRDGEASIRDDLRLLAGTYTRMPHLLGINTHYLDENGDHRHYNSALLVNRAGNVDGRFDKMHRIPFGEYVPLKDWLPFLKALAPFDIDHGIREGEKFTRFPLDKFHFGVLICYEDTDPFLARHYATPNDDGPAVDFLVNMSNDGWFDGSSEHEEHLAVSRFRAIECRRSMVRAANMGISAVIDGNGRVLKPMPYLGTDPPVWIVPDDPAMRAELPMSEWHQFKQVAGILQAAVPIDQRFSFYVLAGDWLPIGCWLFLFGAGGVALVRRRWLPSHLKEGN